MSVKVEKLSLGCTRLECSYLPKNLGRVVEAHLRFGSIVLLTVAGPEKIQQDDHFLEIRFSKDAKDEDIDPNRVIYGRLELVLFFEDGSWTTVWLNREGCEKERPEDELGAMERYPFQSFTFVGWDGLENELFFQAGFAGVKYS